MGKTRQMQILWWPPERKLKPGVKDGREMRFHPDGSGELQLSNVLKSPCMPRQFMVYLQCWKGLTQDVGFSMLLWQFCYHDDRGAMCSFVSVKYHLSLWLHDQQQRGSNSPIPPHPPNFSCFHLPFYSLPRNDLHSCVKNHTSQVNWQKKARSTSLFCCIRSVPLFVNEVVHKQLCCHSAGSGTRTIGGKRGRWQEKSQNYLSQYCHQINLHGPTAHVNRAFSLV